MAIFNLSPATLTDPQLLDHAFNGINGHMSLNLGWLTNVYGRAERFKRSNGTININYPAIYIGEDGQDYQNLFPDEHLQNHSFWWVDDGWEVSEYLPRGENRYMIQASLIFWFDLREIFPIDWADRSTQHVIRLVIESLRTLNMVGTRIKVHKIWEETGNIYRGFTDTEINDQYKMRPYGGFRLEMSVDYTEPCDPMKLEGVGYWYVNLDNIVQ